MEFILNNKQLLFTTVSDDEVLVWKDLGVYPEITKIAIKSAGPINMINAIASVSEPEYGQLITKAKTFISTSKIVTDLKNLSDSTSNLPDVPYSKVSQTEYKIEVKNAPTWVVFSESFDPRWQINGRQSSPVPAYDMLNAFWIEEPGTYRIFYSPQTWVLRGLGIAGSVLNYCIRFNMEA